MSLEFLSDEWFAELAKLRAAAGDLEAERQPLATLAQLPPRMTRRDAPGSSHAVPSSGAPS